MDHGYAVDENRRCAARTKKELQCQLPPLVGIKLCALHAGLAKAKLAPGYGDAKALDSYKRTHAAARA